MIRMNGRPAENPYAAPEWGDDLDSRIAELLQHQPYVVDGDAVLCRGDLSLQNLCYETGLPAQDSRFYAKKIFAPTVRWNHVFRVFHAFNTWCDKCRTPPYCNETYAGDCERARTLFVVSSSAFFSNSVSNAGFQLSIA